MSKVKKVFNSFTFNIVSSIFVLIVAFSVIVCLIGYHSFTNTLKREYRETTYHMANTATTLIKGEEIDDYINDGELVNYYVSYDYLKKYCNYMNVTLIHVFALNHGNYTDATNVFNIVNDKDLEEGTYTEWERGFVFGERYTKSYADVYEQVYKKEIPYGTVYRTKNLRDKDPHVTTIVPILDDNENVVALLAVQRPMSELITGRRPYIITIIVTTIITLVLMCISAGLFIRHEFVKPIMSVTNETKRFAKENKKSDFSDKKKLRIVEIRELSKAIDKMEDDMVKYISDLTEATTAQKKAMVELNIAKSIQESSIPTAFPDRKDFDLFAYMLPAKEVGGDFYNFVQIDDTHIGLVMADVSGKGIPAALFMMASNILLSERLRTFAKPSEALSFLNNRICIHNKTNMFVTIWAGILDLETGHVIACNAGHDDPVIYSKKKGFEIAKSKHNLAIGALEEATYTDYEFDLEKGDKLFLYTDGVVEAMNKNDELFGFDRMVEVLNANKNKAPREIIKNVKAKVDEFAGKREQFDDITMLCIELKEK